MSRLRTARFMILALAASACFVSSMLNSGAEGATWFVGGIGTLILMELQDQS